MASKRIARISEEVKKITSEIIRNKLKDPRISPMTSITEVDVTKDLRYAKVYISILGNKKEKQKTMNALKKASGYIRKEVGKDIKLRYIPELMFYLDESIENGIYMSKLIDKVNNQDKGKKEDEKFKQ